MNRGDSFLGLPDKSIYWGREVSTPIFINTDIESAEPRAIIARGKFPGSLCMVLREIRGYMMMKPRY